LPLTSIIVHERPFFGNGTEALQGDCKASRVFAFVCSYPCNEWDAARQQHTINQEHRLSLRASAAPRLSIKTIFSSQMRRVKKRRLGGAARQLLPARCGKEVFGILVEFSEIQQEFRRI
jgi:hypothetical protein